MANIRTFLVEDSVLARLGLVHAMINGVVNDAHSAIPNKHDSNIKYRPE